VGAIELGMAEQDQYRDLEQLRCGFHTLETALGLIERAGEIVETSPSDALSEDAQALLVTLSTRSKKLVTECAVAAQAFGTELHEGYQRAVRAETARCLAEEHGRPDLAKKLLCSMDNDPFPQPDPIECDPRNPSKCSNIPNTSKQ